MSITQGENQLVRMAIQRGLITKEHLDTALKYLKREEQRGRFYSIIQILLAKKYLSSNQLKLLKLEQEKILLKKVDQLISRELKGCVISSVMGASGLGVTYKGEHIKYNTVLVKVLHDVSPANRNYAERFLKQLQQATALDHPNLAKVYEVRIDSAVPLIIREFIKGESLLDRVQTGPLSVLEATSIIFDATVGLEHLHNAGIIHKNLKPHNILIHGDGTVKVADFGIPPSDSHYLSPEQCRGKKSDNRSDIYSLGVVYYHILAGRPPFEASRNAEIMQLQQSADFPPLRSLVPGIPDQVEKVLGTMLSKRRSERYQNMEEVSSALRELLAEIGDESAVISLDRLKIREYQLLEKLGKGSMGAVLKARSNDDGQIVAIKIITPELTKSKEFTQRFLREMQTILRLDHPNIVRALDCGVDVENDLYFAVMEFVEGESLQERLEREFSLDLATALDFAKQIAQGLQHAYEQGVVHRDIKPDNILLDKQNTAKIVDFGLSKSKRDNAALTQKGDILGTPHYISPEQAAGEGKEDIRADIYSLGITLYHMIAGRPPFIEGNSIQIIISHTIKPIPPLTDFAPQVPQPVVDLVAKMTAKDPAQRFSTPQEVVEAIEALSLPSTPQKSSRKTPKSQSNKK